MDGAHGSLNSGLGFCFGKLSRPAKHSFLL